MLISSTERLVIFPFSGCQGTGRNVLHFNSAAALFIVSVFTASCQFPHCLAWRPFSRGWGRGGGLREAQPQPVSSGCFRPGRLLGVACKHGEPCASEWHWRPLRGQPQRDTAHSPEIIHIPVDRLGGPRYVWGQGPPHMDRWSLQIPGA